MKKAFITGLTGQDGSYLAEFLLDKGYEVHGIIRRSSVFTTERIDHIFNHERLFTYYGDLTDSSNIQGLMRRIEPDEIYNLGAQSHVAVSFEVPEYTAETSGVAAIRMLDAMKQIVPDARYYQASTSEMFGGFENTAPQSESTPFHPRSPYGAAKVFAHWLTINYRESFGLHASNGILFNRESPRRGKTFVTRKIAQAVAKIHLNQLAVLKLGNLHSFRDWGHAKDYVEAMWLMLQQDKADDYVISTGKTVTVQRFVELCFQNIGVELRWEGQGLNEVGICKKTGLTRVQVDEKYFRPLEVDFLQGNSSKAKQRLGWEPKIGLDELASEMVSFELENRGL
jgi:GDPmannose 4,6-dehydratase